MQTLVVSHQQKRELHKAGDNHQRITDVAGQAKKHFELDAHWQRRIPDAPVKLEPNLQDPFGPTPLLRFEGINLNRDFGRRFFVKQVNKSPAHQLGAKTQISVFGERVVLPASAQQDGLAPPDAGGAIKVEKVSAPITRGLLNDEVTVEHDGLQSRQQVI